MTGLHPHQAGIGHMTETPEIPSPLVNEPYQGHLNENCVTIAQLLGRSGYHTLMTGKWHLGYHQKEDWPLQRGFDKFFGIISGASDYHRPSGKRGLTLLGTRPTCLRRGSTWTDAFTDWALDFIKTAKAKDQGKPFFLYLAYNAPHWPLEAKPEDLAKYEGKYSEGWESVSAARLRRQQEMGLIDAAWEGRSARGARLGFTE